jgi:hypothetical protein
MADSDSSEPVQVDPVQPTSDEKAPAVKPDETKGISRLPVEGKKAVSKTDDTIVRLNK